MDALILMREAADGLMARVDTSLTTHGAAEAHEVWGLLRRGGLLPGDALACATDWLPPVLAGRAAQLRRQRGTQAEVSASLSGSAAVSGWEGDAAAAFGARLNVLQGELAAAEEAGAQLATCLDELADWLVAGRHRLARSVAAALTSSEAVTLSVGGPTTTVSAHADAAATLGASVLSEVERFWREGLDIWHRHAARAAAAPRPTVASTDFSASATLHVES